MKSRRTLLPISIADRLRTQVRFVRAQHAKDKEEGFGSVYLPYALNRKYPGASFETGWQYLFPASDFSVDPRSNITRRHHIGERTIQRDVRAAIRESGIFKKASCQTFRHSFAARLLDNGTHQRGIQSPADI